MPFRIFNIVQDSKRPTFKVYIIKVYLYSTFEKTKNPWLQMTPWLLHVIQIRSVDVSTLKKHSKMDVKNVDKFPIGQPLNSNQFVIIM